MIQPTLAQLAQVLTILEKKDFLSFSKVVMGLRSPESRRAILSPSLQLKAYLYEWLRHLDVLDTAQVERLIQHLSPVLSVVAADTSDMANLEQPYLLSISDKTWVQLSCMDKVYSIEDDELLDKLPRPCVTHFVCDMREMFLTKQRWLHKLFGGKDAGHQHLPDATGTEEKQAGQDPSIADG